MKTILFADDSKNIREFCRQSLEEEGYRVLLARDGAEAVRIVQRECVDLAILDVNMPAVDGLEAAEQIEAISASIPIIFFTANGEDRVLEHPGHRATACFAKSDDLTVLIRTVEGMLQFADGKMDPSAHDGQDRQ